MKRQRGPRVLLLDIETLPNVVTSWGLWAHGGLHLSHDNIVKERYIITASWKWLGERRVYHAEAKVGSKEADLPLLKKLARVLDEADAVIAHNGDSFDIPWVKARIVKQGLPPTHNFIQIDTKTVAAKQFLFNSNRLDYLARFLGVGKKIKTDYDLWLDVMAGDKKALRKMIRYNKHDVVVLEGVYLKLRPFIVAKLNRALFVEEEDARSRTCPACGADKLVKKGLHYTRTAMRQSLQCRACGHWAYRLKERGTPR